MQRFRAKTREPLVIQFTRPGPLRSEGLCALKDGSFSFQRVLGDLLLGGGTILRPLKPIPLPKVTSDKKPLTLQFLGKLSDNR